MASDTEICNLALTRGRIDPIGSINERSVTAEKCRTLLPQSRRFLLEAHSWRFAKAVVALADNGDVPAQWMYSYAAPSDMLKPRRVITESGALAELADTRQGANYELSASADAQQKVILTNLPDAYLEYTREVTNPDLFSAQFNDALAWWMTAQLVLVFGGDSGRYYRKEALDEYYRALTLAKATDANSANLSQRRMPRSIAAYGSKTEDREYHYNGKFYRRH